MKIELNNKVIENLRNIHFIMEQEHNVPLTAYFPFVVCFEWVNSEGVSVKSEIQEKRVKLCEAYNLYLQDGGAGSFEQLKLCLGNLLQTLGEKR